MADLTAYSLCLSMSLSVCVNVSVSKESHLLMSPPAVNLFFGNLRATTVASELVDFVYNILNISLFFSQGRKKDKGAGKGLLQWDSERETVLQCLTQLLQLDIRTLWSLSLVEEEFVR